MIPKLLKNIFSNSSSDMLKLNGLYVSKPSFERLDQTFFRHYFKFYSDGKVRKGFAAESFDVIELFNLEPTMGEGKYIIEGNTLIFNIKIPNYQFESTWTGDVNEEKIVFKIDNPDFEDIDGEYTFIEAV